jgi:hypothetical protein
MTGQSTFVRVREHRRIKRGKIERVRVYWRPRPHPRL